MGSEQESDGDARSHEQDARRLLTAFIADERPLLRSTIGWFLSQRSRIAIRGEASTGEDVLRLFRKAPVDVLLIHAELPGMPVTSVIRQVRYQSVATRIVVFADILNSDLLEKLKATPGDALVGWQLTPRALAEELRATQRHWPETPLRGPRVGPLSPRQVQVLELVSDGLTNAQIAQHLAISAGTVKRHLADAFVRLHAQSRVDAINRAIAMGELPPSTTRRIGSEVLRGAYTLGVLAATVPLGLAGIEHW